MIEDRHPFRTVPEAATAAAVGTGAALDPSLTDIRAVEAAAAEAAVRTLPDAAGAGIRRGIADRDAHLPINGIGAWAAKGTEMVRRRLGIAKARKGPCRRTCREAITPDNHFTFSARAPATPTCFTARGGPRKHLRAARFEPAPGGGAIGIACDSAVPAVRRDVRSEGPDRPVVRIFPRCGIRRMAQRLAGCVRIDADGPGFEVGHDGHCGFRAFHHGEADTMANSIHPDRRRPLPSEVTLSRHGRRHPVFLSERLRCFIRAAEIMEVWEAWRLLASEEPAGPHPVPASRDPEFIGLVLPSPGKPGGFVPAPFAMSNSNNRPRPTSAPARAGPGPRPAPPVRARSARVV